MQPGDDPIRRSFDASYRRLVTQLYGVCGDLSEAEDVVAEAFVIAVSRRRTFEQVDNPEAWLRTVAVNVARSRFRRRQLGERLLGRTEQLSPVSASTTTEDRLAVVAALRALPHEQREALALHYLADLPVAEVAEAVGAPVGTVKARLSRGRTALAAALSFDDDVAGEVTAPPYADLVQRGQHRRTVRAITAAGSAALAVVLILGVAQLLDHGRGDASPPPIAPTPTRTPTDTPSRGERSLDRLSERAKAAAIAINPNAQLQQLRVDPSSPQRALAIWSCSGTCGKVRGSAAVVTLNGFRTSSVASIGRGVVFASFLGDGAFLVRHPSGLGQVVYADGRTARVAEQGSDCSGGYPVTTMSGRADRLYLVDPGSASACLLDPPVTPRQSLRLPDGRIEVLGDGGSVVVSSDEGSTWDTITAAPNTPGHALFQLVPAATSDVVLVEGGDGATLFPFDAAHRAEGNQFVRVAEPADPFRFIGGQAVLPDGRMIIEVDGSSGDQKTGYYLSDPTDWTQFTPIAGPPGTQNETVGTPPFDIAVTATDTVIVAGGDQRNEAWVSRDQGATWTPLDARFGRH